MAFEHVPVLLDRVLEGFTSLPEGAVIADCTLGLGGYSEALLERFQTCRVIGVDQDPLALKLASERLLPWGDRFIPVAGNFGDLPGLLRQAGFSEVHGLVADLGVSNLQITEADRGFSFRLDGPLDMRMDPTKGPSAADLVARLSEAELADLIYRYGEDRLSRRIARAIVTARSRSAIKTTGQLADVVSRCYPATLRKTAHPARRLFQALRIAVNDEMGALDRLLESLPRVLMCGGVAQIVSYHSLEDRRIKEAFRAFEGQFLGRSQPRKGVPPEEGEIERNPKSRSARLRRWLRMDLQNEQGRPGLCRR